MRIRHNKTNSNIYNQFKQSKCIIDSNFNSKLFKNRYIKVNDWFKSPVNSKKRKCMKILIMINSVWKKLVENGWSLWQYKPIGYEIWYHGTIYGTILSVKKST